MTKPYRRQDRTGIDPKDNPKGRGFDGSPTRSERYQRQRRKKPRYRTSSLRAESHTCRGPRRPRTKPSLRRGRNVISCPSANKAQPVQKPRIKNGRMLFTLTQNDQRSHAGLVRPESKPDIRPALAAASGYPPSRENRSS